VSKLIHITINVYFSLLETAKSRRIWYYYFLYHCSKVTTTVKCVCAMDILTKCKLN